MSSSLKILQWNCRSINGKVDLLKKQISETKPNILCLQSLTVSYNNLPVIPGYFAYPPAITENNRVKVCIYIDNNLIFNKIDNPSNIDQEIFATTISLQTNPKPINIVNLYAPKGISTKLDWLNGLDTNCSWLILGDFNAKDKLWQKEGPYSASDELNVRQPILDSGLVVLNTGEPTRLPDVAEHKPSAIDLTLISSDLGASATWSVGDDPMLSDHLPILTEISNNAVHTNKEDYNVPHFNYDKADWDLFSNLLSETSTDQLIHEDIDVFYDNVKSSIILAANKSIPKYTPKQNLPEPNPWWNSVCDKVVKDKKKALRAYLKDKNSVELYNNMKTCRQIAKRVIMKEKEKYWETFTKEELKDYKDLTKAWKQTRKIKGSYKPPNHHLLVNNKKVQGALDKAQIFAKTFAAVSQSKNLNKKDRLYRQEQESKYKDPKADNSLIYNNPITLNELKSTLDQIKKLKKATGEDLVSYSMIKHLPVNYLKLLLKLFQKCWEQGLVPKAWKSATVIPIAKQGKPLNNPSSYRPVSLTPHVGKVYERIVANRLIHYLEQNKILPPCQAGFRRGRGCIDQLTRLTTHIKRHMSHSRTVFATFFDVNRAFDTVWHSRLLHKLGQIGVKGRLFQFIKNFLRNRTLSVQVGSKVSDSHQIDMGVPQGSIIAPTLFNLMLYDINKLNLEGATLSQYADDLAVWADCQVNYKNHLRIKSTIFRYQKVIDKLSKYMHDNGFKFSAEKTKFMVFKKKKISLPTEFIIKVDDTKVKPSKSVKFLGLTFDQYLTWKEHINSVTAKANRALNIIKCLKHEKWSNNRKVLTNIVRSLVRSRLSYGQECFFSASPNLLKKLSRVETRALKLALDIPAYALNDLVYQQVGWLPLDHERRARTAQYKARAFKETNPTQEIFEDKFKSSQIHKATAKWHNRNPKTTYDQIPEYIEPLITKLKINPAQIEQTKISPIPPWNISPMEIIDNLGNLTKNENPNLIASKAREVIAEEYSDFLKIYTDGTRQEDGQAGCAVVCPQNSYAKQYKLNNHISIMMAELFAIKEALAYISQIEMPSKVVILTDSKSSLQSFSKSRGSVPSITHEIKLMAHTLSKKNCKVVFQWVPSHVGLLGNELADKAAKNSVTASEAQKGKVPHTAQSVNKSIYCIARNLYSEIWKTKYPTLPQYSFIFNSLPVKGKTESLMRRILTDSPKFKFCPETTCGCGRLLTLEHLAGNCSILSNVYQFSFKELETLKLGVNIHNIMAYREDTGWSLAARFCRCLLQTQLAGLI